MNALPEGAVYWDPYRPDFWTNPYPTFQRLREEAPLYHNAQYDFYAVSRFTDVESALSNKEALSSSRGDIMEFIKANVPVPNGMFIWEDPPVHTVHRAVVSRVFTPKRMNDLEEKIRVYCAHALDPLVGAGKFDFIADLGMQLPMRVISMLLGIPEEDQEKVRDRVDATLATEAGKPMDIINASNQGEGFEEYIDWRLKHPSDDLMTELLNVEFVDETGTTRKLTREEVLAFTSVIAGAGNETTNRLIGWTGKILSDYPEQRAQIAKNPALINNAIEEILRYESPGPSVARYVLRDIQFHGQTVPAGTVLLALVASANRDERRYENADRFDIHRQGPPHVTFGRGIHACLGSALARVEARVALAELLKRFPDWTIDMDNAKLKSTSTVRGWETLPAFVGTTARRATKAATSSSPEQEPTSRTATANSGASENWELTLATPMGAQTMTAQFIKAGDKFTGTIKGEMGVQEINGTIAGNELTWTLDLTSPAKIKLTFKAIEQGDAMTGNVKLGVFGNAPLTGKRIQ